MSGARSGGGAADESSDELGLGLKPGADHYRAYVGPPEDYDLIAAMTFGLLAALGLRQHHAILDIGCGSLRVGRLLIPYLNRGNYVGIEPNERLVADGLQRELGADIVRVKQPVFIYRDSADLSAQGKQVDFAVAQSIFSHCGLDLLNQWMSATASSLKPTGALVATFVRSGTDTAKDGWIYPEVVGYTDDTVRSCAEHYGFRFRLLDWRHPRQTWALAAKPGFDTSWMDGRPLGWNTWFDYGRRPP